MRFIPLAIALSAMVLAAVPAMGQQGSSSQAAGTAGQAQRPGPRPGMGPGVGREFTPGWAMMSETERDAHRQQMSNATSAQECRRIRDEHLKLMAKRARERGMASMPIGRRDACAKFAP